MSFTLAAVCAVQTSTPPVPLWIGEYIIEQTITPLAYVLYSSEILSDVVPPLTNATFTGYGRIYNAGS